MVFIKHIFKEDNTINNIKRLDYIYNKFCADKSISTIEFATKINEAYYRFAAPLYSPGYESTLKSAFVNLFKSIPAGRDIVDVGAGTGSSFRLIQDVEYLYNDYYFIEPSRFMLDRFVPNASQKSKGTLKIFCTNLESVPLMGDRPRIFILAAVLRAIVNLDDFLKDLRKKMRPGDILFLPVEPNNESFMRNSITTIASWLHTRTIGFALRVITGLRRRLKLINQNHINESTHLERSLKLLIETGVVLSDFTQRHLYAIVYYHNFEWWRQIDIPADSDEGFFTPEGVANALGASLVYFEAFNFFQDRPSTQVGKWIELKIKATYPRHGSYFTAAFIKR